VFNSAEEMIKYFDNELENKILKYRTNFLWLEAEDKWGFLNCCLEYEKYLLFGESYTTGMPIYFDATCSGSQLVSLLFGLSEYKKELNLEKRF